MSLLKQVLHYSSITNFPTTGAVNVLYIDDSQIYGKTYYWDGSGYKKTLGDILQFPYSNVLYPALTTIGEALNYLLNPALSVSLIVTPDNTYSTDLIDVSFMWILSKDVANIDTIVITSTQTLTTPLPGSDTLKATYTNNTVGVYVKEMAFTDDVTFTITVTDTEGNVATATDTILFSTAKATVKAFTVSPTSWSERPSNNVTSHTLAWEIETGKAYIKSLTLYKQVGSTWDSGQDVLTDYTATNGTGGIVLPDVTTEESFVYKLEAESLNGDLNSKEATLQFIPYVDIAFVGTTTVSPANTTGIEQQFTFAGRLSKTKTAMIQGTSYLYLYQCDSNGDVIAYTDPDYVLGAYNTNGQDYVNLWSDLLSTGIFSKQLSLEVLDNTYFKIVVQDQDTHGNTSTAETSPLLITQSTDVQLSDFILTPSLGYTDSDPRPFTATANTHIPLIGSSLPEIEYLRIEFLISGRTTITETIPEESYPSVDSLLDYDFTKTLTNGGVAGTYNAYLKYKEVGGEEISSNQSDYKVCVIPEIASNGITITKTIGTTYNAKIRLNKILDGTASVVYSIEGGGSITASNVSTQTVNGASELSFSITISETTGSVTFDVTVTENLGTAGGGLTKSAQGTLEYTVGVNPVYWGVVDAPYDTTLVDLRLLLTNSEIESSNQISSTIYGTTTQPYFPFPGSSYRDLLGITVGLDYYTWIAVPQTNPVFPEYFDYSDPGGWHLSGVDDFFNKEIFTSSSGVSYRLYITKNKIYPMYLTFK